MICILKTVINTTIDMKKKHDKKYIEFAKNKICDILDDNRGYSYWTQISLSAKDAVKALADVIGSSDEESI